jgi:hypothetical protein
MVAAPSAIETEANAIFDKLDREFFACGELGSPSVISPSVCCPDDLECVSAALASAEWFELFTG